MSLEWMAGGLCRQDPDRFFPPDGMSHIPAAQREAAKAICRRCPVRRPCLEYALTHPDQAANGGIWGGTDSSQRGLLRFHRQRRTQQEVTAS